MPVTAGDDGSEDVNDFLLRIRELGDQRDKEDEERTRKLEEEIIQGRRERQARRAERARSLSPTKDHSSNIDTPGLIRSGKDMPLQENFTEIPILRPTPSTNSGLDDAPRKINGAPSDSNVSEAGAVSQQPPQPVSKSQTLCGIPPSAAIAPSRVGTLSWQQRPTSREPTGPRSRPLPMLAAEDCATKSPRESTEPESTNDSSISRNQIGQSLEAKDPTWFKQTQDRGIGSAAYRRNRDDIPDTSSVSGSMRLPGMSRDSTVEPDSRLSPPLDSVRSSSPSTEGSIRRVSGLSQNRSSTASLSSASGVRCPFPTMSNQKLEPPSSDTTSIPSSENSSIFRTLAMSPSQERISPERMDRPSSPTKGLGGFVQSAMMKRSDSVSKRWSAQVGPGLSRGNSVTSNTSGYGASRYPRGGISPLTESRPNSISRENTPATESRPGSSQSNATITKVLGEYEKPGISTSLASNKTESTFDEDSTKPARDLRPSPPLKEITSPPASPSKRWSPSKSSWLENAINRPDSPKIKMPAPQQPAWMADVARAKHQRGSVELSRGNNFKELTTGGLVRSPPLSAGYKPPSSSGLPSGFSAGLGVSLRTTGVDDTSQIKDTPDSVVGEVASRISSPTQTRSPKQPEIKSRSAGAEDAGSSKENSHASPPANKKASELGPRTVSPTATKLKPATPPPKDFKSTLKPRRLEEESKTQDEAEFKNVFGKLKRTRTQNYKAPDELKDNIMRGKAGLAQTGGPKKTERKDEFTESILQKKRGMVAPSASTKTTSASSKVPDETVPEAIAKKNGLTRSESLMSNDRAGGEKDTAKPEALAKLQHLRDKPRATPSEGQSKPLAVTQEDTGLKGPLGGDFTSSLAGMLQRGPLPMAGKLSTVLATENVAGEGPMPTTDSEPTSMGPQLKHATKTRAKGPKRRLPMAIKKGQVVEPQTSAPAPQSKQLLSDNEPTTATTICGPQTSPSNPTKPELRPLSNITDSNNRVSWPSSPRKPSTSIILSGDVKIASLVSQSPIKESQAKTSPTIKQKPTWSPKANNSDTSLLTAEHLPGTPAKRSAAQELPQHTSQPAPEQQMREIESQGSDRTLSSVRGAAALWGQSPKPTQLGQLKPPVKLLTRKNEEASLEAAGLKPKEPAGLGMNPIINEAEPRPERKIASSIAQSPKSPPLPGKKLTSIASRAPPPTLHSIPTISPIKSCLSQPSEALELLADIFDEVPNSSTNTKVETEAIVNARASEQSSQKIKTFSKQIFELTSNGKSVPVPSKQEHILFEDRLYLCTHVFGSSSGQRTTEVYLWCGDGISSSSVEDAQIFAKRVAKDNNGKLIILKQGKETTNFFQALGGIVIIRRGPSSQVAGSSVTYMLCGRQHGGQIAFDEVDCTRVSLCPGFPHIVLTRSGKLYLWKGSGSGANELGCARLIGMDLGLTGDIEEIDEGREPDAFWQTFPEDKQYSASTKGASAEHWHLKSSCENYTTRLFAIDVEMPRPKSSTGFIHWGRRGSAPSNDPNAASTPQIKEIMPFAQSDLVDGVVFVLDAFFEVFIIFIIRSLTPAPQHKSTKSAAFRAALVFAQEYGILAASAEDRPFVPYGSVVICSRSGPGTLKEANKIPECMQRAFRKWDGKAVGECRILPLTAALEATGG